MSIIDDYCNSVNYTEDLILSIESTLGHRFPGIKIHSVNHNLESGNLEINMVNGQYTAEQVTSFLDEICGRTKKQNN